MNNSCRIKYFRNSILSLFLLIIAFRAFPNAVQERDSVLHSPRTFKAEELVRGERLFYGLVYQGKKSVNCAACHNTRFSDTLNWNPDAIEISVKYLEKSPADLSRVLLKPTGGIMAEVHKGFQLTSEDIVLIKAYMDELPEIGLLETKPVITNMFLFIMASLLFLISVTDLIVVRVLKKRWIHFLIISVSGIFISYILAADALAVGHSPEYAPDQPVKFSHAIHSGQNGTDCIYCHSYAPYSKSAGIPAENICMNCHLLVRKGARSGTFEIAKVITSFEEQTPIKWIRVYNLPDHVFFSHAQHVGPGQISCQECHGEVEKTDRIKLNNNLTMGWCIDCHRTKNTSFQSNKFYAEYKEINDKLKRGEITDVSVERIGGTECMKCHY